MEHRYDKFREKASSIVPIPENYHLLVEDNVADERFFIWEDPQHPEADIKVTLDLQTGALMKLLVGEKQDNAHTDTDCATPSAGQAKRTADEFIKQYLPDLRGEYTWVYIEAGRRHMHISYRQETGGLPLPFTGCDCIVDSGGNITDFEHYGRKNKPAWPASIADVKTVKQQIVGDLRMKLCIVRLYPSMHEVEDLEYRLVYEPAPCFRSFNAVTGRDLFGPDHYWMPHSHPVPPPQTVPEQQDNNIEELIGVDPHLFVLVREQEDEKSIRYVWKEKEHAHQPAAIAEDRSFKAYWRKKLPGIWLLGNSIVAVVEKSTGRLRQLYKDYACAGNLALSRDECLEKALHFLQRVFPEYPHYLRLQENEEPEDGQRPDREFFAFDIYVNGIPIHLETVRVGVHTATGEIGIYSGVSFEMISMLAGRNFQPGITEQEALKLYLGHLDVELVWLERKEEDFCGYQLIYRPTTSADRTVSTPEYGERRGVQYIDACSGKLIWSGVVKK
ncbi:YcdB/YcdC domain-containing protein [Desulfoscipio sp. XC116]|uniref:YcdB/YcdC domain-containing protein n=1 Tax=Desulfoscipio sp. XC116 TaxID=3144975 RepID=UPI00325AFBD3